MTIEAPPSRPASAEFDRLTGAQTRAAGLLELDRELDRCRDCGGQLVVAYIGVVAPNLLLRDGAPDARDELLKYAVVILREQLRPTT